jgi:hypothetical protein
MNRLGNCSSYFLSLLCNFLFFGQVRYYSQRNKLEFDIASGVGYTTQTDSKAPVWFVFYIDGQTRIPAPCTKDTCAFPTTKASNQ